MACSAARLTHLAGSASASDRHALQLPGSTRRADGSRDGRAMFTIVMTGLIVNAARHSHGQSRTPLAPASGATDTWSCAVFTAGSAARRR
jgi:hypothetical protein